MAQAVAQTKKRIGYFDIAKGIALFAVMVGHTSEYGSRGRSSLSATRLTCRFSSS